MKLFKRQSQKEQTSLHTSFEIRGDLLIKSATSALLENTGHTDNLREEAEELQRCLEQGIHTPHVCPIEFVNYDQTANSLTTRFFPGGTSLFNMLWNSTSTLQRIRKRQLSPELFISRCEELGHWLAQYHHSTSYPQFASQAMHSLQNSFQEKMTGIRKNRLLKEEFLRRVEERFFPEIVRLADERYRRDHQINICKIHADFTPINMLCDDSGNIRILDFAEARIGASLEDVGRFYEFLHQIAHTNRLRKNVYSKAMEAFITGYGLTSQVLQENPFFMAIRAYNGILNYYASVVQRPYLSFFSNRAAQKMTNVSLAWMAEKLSVSFR